MRLYRGMSDLELQAWECKHSFIIPPGINFTTSSREAIHLGERYLFRGDLIILGLVPEDMLFQKIIGKGTGKEGGEWYQTARLVSLEELDSDVLSPGEAARYFF